jgi:arginase
MVYHWQQLSEDNLDYKISITKQHSIREEYEKHWLSGAKMLPESMKRYFGSVKNLNRPNGRIGIRNYKVDEVRYRGLQKCVALSGLWLNYLIAFTSPLM